MKVRIPVRGYRKRDGTIVRRYSKRIDKKVWPELVNLSEKAYYIYNYIKTISTGISTIRYGSHEDKINFIIKEAINLGYPQKEAIAIAVEIVSRLENN